MIISRNRRWTWHVALVEGEEGIPSSGMKPSRKDHYEAIHEWMVR
jgi:hypothetical protein